MELYPHQKEALELTKDFNRCAYYLDMGLGKTYIGSEKMISFNTYGNLVICQKSKVEDWLNHFKENYEDKLILQLYDLTDKKQLDKFIKDVREAEEPNVIYDEWTGQTYSEPSLDPCTYIGVINYDLVFRRKELSNLKNFTILLDESSIIQNDKAKRTKFILKMNPENVILLSGTPSAGKYENLWTQIHLLGWNISKDLYNKQYINWNRLDVGGVPIWVVDKDEPYKNVERLKEKLRMHGAIFKKTEECFDLPEQIFIPIYTKAPKEYMKFKKDGIVEVEGDVLVGDSNFTKRMYARQLCGKYNSYRYEAFEDLLESTSDRIVVFYNFVEEKEKLKKLILEHQRSVSEVNGQIKDLSNYEEHDDSVTLVQYQSGSRGLNLQKANKIVYFSLTESSDLFEQSKKRIHRIGQNETCFYYIMLCKNTIEDKGILPTLEKRKDFDDELFREEIW